MGFNIQPVVNGIIQSTQTTNFPLYSNIQILSIALCYQPKRSELFWGSFSCHMAPVHEHSIEWPPSRSGWSLWEWAGGSHHQNPAQGQGCVHVPRSWRAQEPLPGTPTSVCTSCRSLQFGRHSAYWPFPVDRSSQERGNICRCCCNLKAFPAQPGKAEVLPMCLKWAETSGASLLSSQRAGQGLSCHKHPTAFHKIVKSIGNRKSTDSLKELGSGFWEGKAAWPISTDSAEVIEHLRKEVPVEYRV